MAAIRSAVPPGLEVRLFAGLLRTDYAGPLGAVIDDLENWDDLAGVDLLGWEQVPHRAVDRAGVVAAARREQDHQKSATQGSSTAPTACAKPSSSLASPRVQHGVRTIEDPAVWWRWPALAARDLRRLPHQQCSPECRALRLAEHPIKRLARGRRALHGEHEDDPLAVFANTVNDEYAMLAGGWASTRAGLAQVARNGWEVALVDDAQRRATQMQKSTV